MDEQKNEDAKKKIDESWKEAVEKEKSMNEYPHMEPPATFQLFATSLMMEALIALGEIEHPVAKKKETNTSHAKFLIDTLSMLQDKTKNNLTKDESEMLESMLYDLRMRFINKVRQAGA